MLHDLHLIKIEVNLQIYHIIILPYVFWFCQSRKNQVAIIVHHAPNYEYLIKI